MLSIKEDCEIMYNNYNYNELYHYGVKGMKWGVIKTAYKVAEKTYGAAQKHGTNVLDKKAQRNDFRSQYHASKGHKLRAKYYDKQAFKTRDSQFDTNKTISAAIKDVSIKSQAVIGAAKVGKYAVQGLLNNLQDKRDYRDARKANQELLEYYNNRR